MGIVLGDDKSSSRIKVLSSNHKSIQTNKAILAKVAAKVVLPLPGIRDEASFSKHKDLHSKLAEKWSTFFQTL